MRSRGVPRILTRRAGKLGSYADELETVAIAALRRAARVLGLNARHEISLVLCDNPTIRILNRRWRARDKPTDVLSFPLHDVKPGKLPPVGPVGDIVLSLPTIRRAARLDGIAETEHVEHLAIHGLLHLLGYEHHTDTEARQMRREEERLLGRKLAT